ncbi:MAG: hypothetical protein ACSHYA_15650 [Opitutaceae bacterium]
MNAKNYILTLLLCILGQSLHAQFMTITNKKGQQIEIQMLSLNAGDVSFLMRDGSKNTIRIETLNTVSRRRVVKWQKANKGKKTASGNTTAAAAASTTEDIVVDLSPNDRIKAYVHTRRKSKDTDGGYTGWKDMDERIQPRVLIENQEYTKDYRKLTTTLVLVGENVRDRSQLKVIFKDSFKFSVSHRDEFDWSGAPFKLDYLVDDNDSYDNSYGFRYRYYLLVIRNADGTVGHTASSRSSWTQDPNLDKRVKVNGIYDRNLK